MRVTIVTPTLNAARYFPECLASVANQTLPRSRLQHLVMDGASSDATVALARDACAEVHVHQDSSLYEALNRGIHLADGDVIAWLNADDTLCPGALESVVRTFEHDPATEVVVGDYVLARPTGARRIQASAAALQHVRGGARHGAWVIPLAVFFRTRTLLALGDYSTRYRIAADFDLWLRAAARESLADRVRHAGTTIGTFRIHGDSLSSGRSLDASARELADVAETWFRRPDAPVGVRRYALFAYRRYTYLGRMWAVRDEPLLARAYTAAACWRDLSRLGPGALGDMRTSVTEEA